MVTTLSPVPVSVAAPAVAIAPPSAAERQSELQQVLALQAHRTPQLDQQAEAFDAHPLAPWTAYLKAYTAQAGPIAGARVGALMTAAITKADVQVTVLKHEYNEPRPYQMDPRIVVLGPHPSDDTSFPSEHASTAYAAATVLAHFWPSQATTIMATAHAEGEARIYSGVHLPSDVQAGTEIGTQAADSILD